MIAGKIATAAVPNPAIDQTSKQSHEKSKGILWSSYGPHMSLVFLRAFLSC